MNRFIYVFDVKTKDKLISMNFHLIQETISNGNPLFVFENIVDDNFLLSNFSKTNVMFSDTLFF